MSRPSARHSAIRAAFCLAAALLPALPTARAGAQPAAATSAAAARPAVLPTRDVAVTYRLAGAAAQAIPGGVPSGLITLRWNAAGQRLRVEAEGRPQVALLDLAAHRATVVDDAMHTAMVLPFSERDAGRLRLDGARFTRQGADTVAGVACTTYAVQHPSGRGTVCLTADGVPLRAEGEVDGKQGSFTAQHVEYGPVPPELFRSPEGYLRLDMGNLGGLGGSLGGLRIR